MEKDIVIGAGEVGKALYNILSKKYNVILKDKEDIPVEPVRVMNICIPYNESFVSLVEWYINTWYPKIVIIHSTVEIGTSDKLENIFAPIVYSPVRGRHPNMEEGLLLYEKIIGTKYTKDAENVKKYFEQVGIPSKIYPDARNAEAAKLMCTTYYGWNIIFAKELEKFCKANELDFQYVYTDFTRSYNQHVSPQWRKPIMDPKPGKIGGHCVIPNAEILKGWDVADFITSKNETYEDSI